MTEGHGAGPEGELVVATAGPAAGPGRPVLLLLHGRGADETDLGGMGEMLLPAAAVILPRAPFPGTPWGYGPGWAWYRFLGRGRPDPDHFAESVRRVDALVARLRSDGADGPLVLGGFSQGGTLALGYALTHPGRVAGILNFSGFVPAGVGAEPSADNAGELPVFWGHGLEDPAIPHDLARAGRAALAAAGARVMARDYPIGHWIAPEELADARGWLEALVGRA
jgi:phospholipase/carboxylesterase